MSILQLIVKSYYKNMKEVYIKGQATSCWNLHFHLLHQLKINISITDSTNRMQWKQVKLKQLIRSLSQLSVCVVIQCGSKEFVFYHHSVLTLLPARFLL